MAASKIDIFEYLDDLVQSAEKLEGGGGYSKIWDIFWEGVSELKQRGLNPGYHDPDGSCRDDVLACWRAYREVIKGPERSLEEILEAPPWRG